MTVYVSTSCLAGGRDSFQVLDAYAAAGLKHVELGATHAFDAALTPARLKAYGFELLCHHYYPPPASPLVVNLASRDPAVLAASRRHVTGAIDFCRRAGIPLFSVHAGFRADPDLDFRFSPDNVADGETAFATFAESLRLVDRRAREAGVRLAVENNVLADYNLVEGRNLYLLLCEAPEFERLWRDVPSGNVSMLLDLGHLNVSSRWLGFDKYGYIERVRDRVGLLHVHDNDAVKDRHRPLAPDSWCLEVVRQEPFRRLPVVLESSGLSMDAILAQVALLEEAVA